MKIGWSRLVISLAVLAWALVVEAQPPVKTARIGILCATRCEGGALDALRDELRRFEWIEGRTLTIEQRGAGGQPEQLPALAAELVRLKPDVIIAVAPQPSRAAKNATGTIPIVMIGVADPVAAGLAQSLARPGGNVTGLATLVPGGFLAKQLELLKEASPQTRRIAVLTNPANEIHRARVPDEVPSAALRLGVQAHVVEARTAADIEGAIESAVRMRAEGLLVVGDPIFHNPSDRVPTLAMRAKLPAMCLLRELAEAGCLLSYGPEITDLFRRAAGYVDRILKGAKPGDIPIEQPIRFEFVINVKTAKALGMTIPPPLLLRADKVIE